MPKGTGINKKYKPTGVLADIIGGKSVTYAQASKKIWDHIHDVGCQGEKGDGESVTFNGRKYVGGQVIHTGDCPMLKKCAGGKNKIAMVQIGKFTKKYMKEI